MARGIEWITTSNDYETLRQAAIDTANLKFDKDVIAAQYRDLYERILK